MSNDNIIKENFKDFYDNIKPLMGGGQLINHSEGCIPCGKVEAFYRETAPDGYLICDGTEYAKADYPKLASILLGLTEHTDYEGSDSDHFKVPDLRGEFLRGSGTNSHANQGSGASVGEHQDATDIPYVRGDSGYIYASDYNALKNVDINRYNGTGRAIVQGANDSSGNKSIICVRPTNTSVLFCIAAQDIYLTTDFPIGFDESDNERQVSWYKRADGMRKPIYKKDFIGVLNNLTTARQYVNIYNLQDSNFDILISSNGFVKEVSNGYYKALNVSDSGATYTVAITDNKYLALLLTYNDNNLEYNISIEYTKTTDEWQY